MSARGEGDPKAVEISVDVVAGFRQRRAVSRAPACAPEDDAALVRAAQGGDRAAFGKLYQRYARMVHGVLLARVPHHEAGDLVQDVFLLALRKLHLLREPGAFGGWLCVIARNRVADFHRRAVHSSELPEELPGRHPRRAEALAALGAIRRLPEAYRETLILRLVEGMTGPEIAARTGMTPASVRVNLHRGMKLLRETLGLSDPRGGMNSEENLEQAHE
jgi:RNA polymerase sigma-70 factor (ECF subfamily)